MLHQPLELAFVDGDLGEAPVGQVKADQAEGHVVKECLPLAFVMVVLE